jgi:hypothetical protein
MSAALISPAAKYAPPKLVDAHLKSERIRLSKPALKAFFKIMEAWRIRGEDARELLGSVPSSVYYNLKKTFGSVLEPDKLTRISLLIGIYQALNIVYGKKLANDWVSLPNTSILFNGKSPLSYMISGGIPAMETVRRLLDARRGM